MLLPPGLDGLHVFIALIIRYTAEKYTGISGCDILIIVNRYMTISLIVRYQCTGDVIKLNIIGLAYHQDIVPALKQNLLCCQSRLQSADTLRRPVNKSRTDRNRSRRCRPCGCGSGNDLRAPVRMTRNLHLISALGAVAGIYTYYLMLRIVCGHTVQRSDTAGDHGAVSVLPGRIKGDLLLLVNTVLYSHLAYRLSSGKLRRDGGFSLFLCCYRS